MDRLQADRLRGRLFALLIGFDDRLSRRDAELIHEFMDVGEFVLSLEQIADVLAEDERALTDDERVEVLALVEEMEMDDRVPSAVGRYPRTPGLQGHTGNAEYSVSRRDSHSPIDQVHGNRRSAWTELRVIGGDHGASNQVSGESHDDLGSVVPTRLSNGKPDQSQGRCLVAYSGLFWALPVK